MTNIREKVEARKAELQAELVDRNAAERAAAKKGAANTLASLDRAVASMQAEHKIGAESDSTSATSGAAIAPMAEDDASALRIENMTESEVRASVAKRARSLWSDAETTTFGALVIGAIVVLFINWVLAVGIVIVCIVFHVVVNGKYKRALRERMSSMVESGSGNLAS